VTWDLIALGEPLLRLQPLDGVRLEQADRLHAFVGGAELNVAYALAGLGRRCALFSAVPEGPLGRRVLRHLRAGGVDTSFVHVLPGRLGLYWVDYGREPRSIEVHYDRAGSAFCALDRERAPRAALQSCRTFFVSGITPALSPSLRDLALEMAAAARAAGVTVAVDLNYRSRLWSVAQAAPVLEQLARQADVLVAPDSDLRTLFGWEGTSEDLLRRAAETFGSSTVAVTCGGEGAVCVRQGRVSRGPVFPAVHVDRVGAGDAFIAGLLHALLDGREESALDYGLAMAALKHGLRGDTVTTTAEELARLATREMLDIRR
jgi:2-dehydro-3-deoxygluconokinase